MTEIANTPTSSLILDITHPRNRCYHESLAELDRRFPVAVDRPQPDSWKAGDQCEWRYDRDDSWKPGHVVRIVDAGFSIIAESSLLIHCSDLRPLQNVKVEHLTSIVSAADACVELVKERDTLRETIAAKDAQIATFLRDSDNLCDTLGEIRRLAAIDAGTIRDLQAAIEAERNANKALESVNAGFWETLVERKEIIDSLRAKLADQGKTTDALIHAGNLDRGTITELRAELAGEKRSGERGREYIHELKREVDALRAQLETERAKVATSETDAKIVKAVRGRIDSAEDARSIASWCRTHMALGTAKAWDAIADALEGK